MTNISEVLKDNGGDIKSLRPRLDENGKSWVMKNGEVVPSEIVGLCTKQDFIDLDVLTLRSARYHFHTTHALMSYGGGCLVLNMDGLSVCELQYTPGECNEVEDSMIHLPLPIAYSKWNTLNDGGAAAHTAARETAKEIEKMVVGSVPPFGKKVFGLLNHPERLTILQDDTYIVDQIDKAITKLEENKFYGPYIVFTGHAHDMELSRDCPKDNSMCGYEAILKISREGASTRSVCNASGKYIGGQPCDPIYYPVAEYHCLHTMESDIVVVQATPDNIRIVVGRDIIPVRWEDGFMTMAIIVPQIRKNKKGKVGIAHLFKT